MSIELTEELRRNKAQFRYLRERCGISLNEIAEKTGLSKSSVAIPERPGRKTYPSAKAWEYLLEQFEKQEKIVEEIAEKTFDAKEFSKTLEIFKVSNESSEAEARMRHCNSVQIETAAVLCSKNINVNFIYSGRKSDTEDERSRIMGKATFFAIRKRCRLLPKTVTAETGYKNIQQIVEWENPNREINVPERAFEWAKQKLEEHEKRVQAVIDNVEAVQTRETVKQVLFPYFTSQKHFNLYKTDSISFSEINAANTEAAARLEKLGIEPVFLYPETGYEYSDEYLIKTD